jgi:hypothetical protein
MLAGWSSCPTSREQVGIGHQVNYCPSVSQSEAVEQRPRPFPVHAWKQDEQTVNSFYESDSSPVLGSQ